MSLPRRQLQVGYTLMELGIVMSVVGVLLAVVVVSSAGMYRSARAQRTGGELADMARAAADALRRNLVVAPGPVYNFRSDGVNPQQISATTPACYDLSRFPGSTRLCPTTGAVGPTWNSPYAAMQPVPAGSPLLSMLGGSKIYGNGFTAWCTPFAVCLYPFRAEVLTCVPANDLGAAGLSGAQRCGACGTISPVSNEPTVCVLVSVSTFKGNATGQLQFSYSNDLYTLPRPPPVYRDYSPHL